MKEKWPSFNRNVVNREAYTVDKPANGGRRWIELWAFCACKGGIVIREPLLTNV